MNNEFKITTEEYAKFQASFTFEILRNPTYRYGQAFMNYFHPDAQIYLRRLSDQYDDLVLYNLSSAKEADQFIRERIEII